MNEMIDLAILVILSSTGAMSVMVALYLLATGTRDLVLFVAGKVKQGKAKAREVAEYKEEIRKAKKEARERSKRLEDRLDYGASEFTLLDEQFTMLVKRFDELTQKVNALEEITPKPKVKKANKAKVMKAAKKVAKTHKKTLERLANH